jgi:predicted transcriptional regulator YdeE
MPTRRRFADLQFAAGLFTFLFISIAGVGEGDMNPKVVQQRGFTVVGIAARTSNAREATADGVIGKQWGRFMQEGLLAKIPNKTDSAIVAVYTDYASDANGEYTYLLGARVKADRVNLGHDVPAGMVAKKIPAGRYAVFTSEKGPAPKVVPATWKRIWETPKPQPGGDRAYGADFEVYDQRAADPENAQVDVYVGIR